MSQKFDVIVIGGGIVGLACAYHARNAGYTVCLLERSGRANGASVRNFGMVWPIGRRTGADVDRAMRSRQHWINIAQESDVWINQCGSVHVARNEYEASVLQEFAEMAPGEGRSVVIESPSESLKRIPTLNQDGLICTLWSDTECAVLPTQAIGQIASYLSNTLGVDLRTGAAVTRVEPGAVQLADGTALESGRTVICSGADFVSLFPALYAAQPLSACQLQMMRTQVAEGDTLSMPHVAGGLSLLHYPAFEDCTALSELGRHYNSIEPAYDELGIHVMAAMTPSGELTIGDSHVYGDQASWFRDERIDELILNYLDQMFAQRPAIKERWLGVYAKRTDGGLFIHERAAEGVEILNGFGGMGMTLALGVAEELIASPGELIDPFGGVPAQQV